MAFPEGGIPEHALKGLADLQAAVAEEQAAGGELEVTVEDAADRGDDMPIVQAEDDGDEFGLQKKVAKRDEDEKDEDERGARDEDEDDYSAKVKKRIEREARLKREAREEANREKERADRLERELAEFRAKKDAEGVDQALAEAKEKLKAARMDVDFDAETEAHAEIARLMAKKERGAQAAPVREESSQKQPAQDDESAKPKKNPLVESWYGRNKWFADERYAEQAAAAVAINNRMLADGWTDSDPDFYRELDKKIRGAIRFPDGVLAERESTVDPGTNDGTVGEPGARKSGKVVLTRADMENMRRYGMDPTNKEHLKEYARNKGA